MKKYSKYIGLAALLLVLVISSCKSKKKEDPYANLEGHYFSINQYALDQWNTFAHSPFTIVKTVKVNKGKTDSSYTNSDSLDWSPIFKVFAETDISDRKYLGKYKFSQFDDNQDGTHNFFYEALEEDLFTQKLLITIDAYNSRVKGIYIETSKKISLGEYTQKLYYKPMKTIQVQTDNRPFVGDNKFTIVQYDFML